MPLIPRFEMLNKLDNEYMVFSKTDCFIYDPGDTVFWNATNKGHSMIDIC